MVTFIDENQVQNARSLGSVVSCGLEEVLTVTTSSSQHNTHKGMPCLGSAEPVAGLQSSCRTSILPFEPHRVWVVPLGACIVWGILEDIMPDKNLLVTTAQARCLQTSMPLRVLAAA